ncbi:hypothetical protein CLOM_g9200 [Closterium sp. NIES-68]|nr:hypothetical protein CLOM_g9200 [Closterium sp. NIES-68]GJP63073.1 hypothetical protein CLOP_g20145 [Closterium sp. NIES-67]
MAARENVGGGSVGGSGGGGGGDAATSESLSARGVVLHRFVSAGDSPGGCQLAWSLRADSLRSSGAREGEVEGNGEGKDERKPQGMAEGGIVATKVEGQLFQEGRPLYAFRGDSAQALDSTINVSGNVLVSDSQSGTQFSSGGLAWSALESRLSLTGSVTCSLPGIFHVNLPRVIITRASLAQLESEKNESGPAGEGSAEEGSAGEGSAREAMAGVKSRARLADGDENGVSDGSSRSARQNEGVESIFEAPQKQNEGVESEEQTQLGPRQQHSEQQQTRLEEHDSELAGAQEWWLTADAHVVAHGPVTGWVSLPSSLVSGSLRGISRLMKDAESTQRQQQGEVGHGRHGLAGSGGGSKRRDGGKSEKGKRGSVGEGRAWTGVECAGGLVWNVPRGEISLAGPMSASCPSMDGQVRAGGGVIWLQRKEALLHSQVQVDLHRTHLTAPRIRWRHLAEQEGIPPAPSSHASSSLLSSSASSKRGYVSAASVYTGVSSTRGSKKGIHKSLPAPEKVRLWKKGGEGSQKAASGEGVIGRGEWVVEAEGGTKFWSDDKGFKRGGKRL